LLTPGKVPLEKAATDEYLPKTGTNP